MSADAAALAMQIDRRISALPYQTTQAIREVRREYSSQLRTTDGARVLDVADALVESQRWVAYELVYHQRRWCRPSRSICDRRGAVGMWHGRWTSVNALSPIVMTW